MTNSDSQRVTEESGSSANQTVRTVVKVGGSLLMLSDLAERVQQVLETLEITSPLLIVGGGDMVDLVRDWDDRHHLTDSGNHQLALKAMGLTAELIHHLVPGTTLVSEYHQIPEAHQKQLLPIGLAESLLKPIPEALPESWIVTSDSIAIQIANHWQAERVLFLKSVSLSKGRNVSQSVAEGLLDEYLPTLLALLPTRPLLDWINLRESPFMIQQLQF